MSGGMENSYMMFDHTKHLKDWTTMACHVYNDKYYQMLTIVCCDMQFEDGATQIIFLEQNQMLPWQKNGVPHVNFKGFMANSVQAN